MKRGLKIGELITKWDKDGDNTVSKPEFRQNVLDMGVEAPADKIDEVRMRLPVSSAGCNPSPLRLSPIISFPDQRWDCVCVGTHSCLTRWTTTAAVASTSLS